MQSSLVGQERWVSTETQARDNPQSVQGSARKLVATCLSSSHGEVTRRIDLQRDAWEHEGKVSRRLCGDKNPLGRRRPTDPEQTGQGSVLACCPSAGETSPSWSLPSANGFKSVLSSKAMNLVANGRSVQANESRSTKKQADIRLAFSLDAGCESAVLSKCQSSEGDSGLIGLMLPHNRV